MVDFINYKVGDVVRLKGSDQKMTVSAVGNQGCVCAWFDVEGKAHSKEFALVLLEKAPKDPVEVQAPEPERPPWYRRIHIPISIGVRRRRRWYDD